MKNDVGVLLGELVEKMEIPVWLMDRNGNLIFFNKTFELFYQIKFHKKVSNHTNLATQFSEIFQVNWNKFIEEITNGNKPRIEIHYSFKNTDYFFEVATSFIDQYIICWAFNITDRKNSLSILNKAKSQLQALVNNIPALIWLKDQKGNYIVINQKFKDFFECNNGVIDSCKIKDPTKKVIFDYLSNDSFVAERRSHYSEEKEFVLSNRTIWFEIHKTPIFNEHQELVGVTGMAQEITERKTIELVLLESEEKFRQFAENTSDSFILSSTDHIIYVNPAFEKIYGRTIDEGYTYRHIPADWIYHEDRKRIVDYFSSSEYEKTGKFNGHYRIIKPDGTISWIWERSFPVRDEYNNIIRYISVASDITRQKELEAELLVNQAQQQAILDNIPHMAWLKDVSGRYVSVNEAFARYYKKSKHEIIGKTDADICQPDLAELYAYNDYLVLSSKQQQHFSEFIDTVEGTIYSETIKTPVFDADGNVIGLAGISQDVTQYKRMEQKLRANEERIRALLLHSNESITVVDNEGRIIFDSSFFYKLAGISANDAVGRSFTEFVSSSDEGLVLWALNKVIENPDSQENISYACIKPETGEIVYFESYFTNYLDNPVIGGVVINTRDITNQKMAEKKEMAYHQRVSFLERTALDFLSISSSDEIYKYIGENIRELVPDSIVIFSDYDENTDTLVIKNLSGGQKYLGVVFDMLGRDPIDYHMKLTPAFKRKLIVSSNKLHELNGGLYNITNRQIDYMVCRALEKLISMNKAYGMGMVRSNKLLGSIIILTRYENFIDDPRVIETFLYQASIALMRRKLEKELIQAKEKAEESDRLKTAFLANMSHEIRTPINGIIGFSQLLEHAFDDPEKRDEYLQIIRTNANMLLSLIDDIIDVSRIQEGQVKLKKSIVNINLLLDDILTPYMNPIAQGKEIVTSIEKALPDEDAIVVADPLRLKQILNNLISNAFKFTEKGAITVGYTVDNHMIIFYVADTGIGIPEDKLETIFNRFTQADVSFTRRYGGSGLGLAICKGLVELMGGKIWVESTVGLGSKFYFSLPGLCSETITSKHVAAVVKNNSLLMN